MLFVVVVVVLSPSSSSVSFSLSFSFPRKHLPRTSVSRKRICRSMKTTCTHTHTQEKKKNTHPFWQRQHVNGKSANTTKKRTTRLRTRLRRDDPFAAIVLFPSFSLSLSLGFSDARARRGPFDALLRVTFSKSSKSSTKSERRDKREKRKTHLLLLLLDLFRNRRRRRHDDDDIVGGVIQKRSSLAALKVTRARERERERECILFFRAFLFLPLIDKRNNNSPPPPKKKTPSCLGCYCLGFL